MGTKTGGIVGLALLALSGCAALEKGGGYAANPVVVGTLSVASQKQCEQFAKSDPDAAKTTGQYLTTLSAASAACVDGIQAGLVK